MYNIIRLYNQNRRKFWISTIMVIVIAMIIWRLINMFTEAQTTTPQVNTVQLNESDYNSVAIESTKSAVTGQDISGKKDEITIIDKFIEFCNDKKINEAYDLLSKECKELMYPNVQTFYSAYYTPVFGGDKKNVTIENWVGNIYKIDFREDFLSTGKYTKENTKQDYISLKYNSEGDYKLNINKYIRTSVINKTNTIDNVKICLIKKDTYMDYEIYTFEIENNSDDTVKLMQTENIGGSYLVDLNNIKYNAASSELSNELVSCISHSKNTIEIKYLNQYSSNRKIERLVFESVSIGNNNKQISFEL